MLLTKRFLDQIKYYYFIWEKETGKIEMKYLLKYSDIKWILVSKE